MHSRSNSIENISEVQSSKLQAQVQQGESKCDESLTSFQDLSRSCYEELPVNMSTVQPKHRNNRCSQACNKNCELSGNSRDLSHDDLLLLLSILEGELQARDEVITVLRAEKTELASLEAHYGFMTPAKVLQALQRDKGIDYVWQEDIYEKPIAELDKLVEKQKETYRRMLENLLLVEQAHKQTLYRLEDEKHNHSEYMKKCDEFTNLLEHERERLKLLNDQEKASQEQREEENNRKVTNLTEELTKLKSFALLLIDEQQRVTEQLTQQTAKVQDLQAAAKEAQEELNSARTRAQKMESKVLHLESELHAQVVQFQQEQEVMSKNLSEKNNLNQHLHQKLSTLRQELTELEQSNKAFRRAEEELQELKDKNSNRENGTSSLVLEVEELRKKVVEMEEKDDELIKMEDLCRNLKKNLERESTQNCSLKTEVDKLNLKIIELEKLQDAFEKSEQEFSSIKCNLEKERTVTKHMCNEIDNLRLRIKELEAAESLLEKTEWKLKEDLTKLKTLTVKLVDEKTTMAEKLKQLEIKVQSSTDKLQVEQEKVTVVTEKLIEESKKALKFKVELEEKICIVTRERDDFETKLKTEKEKNNALQSKVSMMEKRLQALEAVEREFLRNKAKQENIKGPIQNGFQQEHNKVKDLTQNVKWLRWKLSEKNVVKGDLPKTHDAGETLKIRYSSEKALMEELEIARMELSRYQLVEKKNFNQEHSLYKHLKEEEVKSNHLTKEVEALKEKIYNYMGTEESICNMKTEYASIQKKLTQQELRNKELAREKESLTRELERYRRFSKSLRPGMIGKRFSDLQVTTKEVQTEPIDSPIHTYENFSLLECAVMNGKINEKKNEQHYKEINPAKCSPPLKNSNNNTVNLRNDFLKSMEKQQLTDCKLQTTENRSHIQQADMLVTHIPSQHLHSKVTPDYSHTTAALKIKNSITENTQSYTSTAVIPTSGCTRKQKITIIQNAPGSKQNNSPSIKSPSTPELSMSPVSMTTYCQTVNSEFNGLLTPNFAVPSTETTTITTGNCDKALQTEVKAGHNVFCVTPPRQNKQYVHGYNSSSPSVITNEDNKIHIHLGIPYLKPINSNIEPCSPGYSAGQKQSTSVLTSDTLGKVNSKVVGSIRINPTTPPIPQPSQITVSSV